MDLGNSLPASEGDISGKLFVVLDSTIQNPGVGDAVMGKLGVTTAKTQQLSDSEEGEVVGQPDKITARVGGARPDDGGRARLPSMELEELRKEVAALKESLLSSKNPGLGHVGEEGKASLVRSLVCMRER